jgi:hypothetical protein
MLYARKTGTILVPTMREERTTADHLFVFGWKLIGGHFMAARVGVDTASFMEPRHPLVKKRRVRIMASASAVRMTPRQKWEADQFDMEYVDDQT